MAFGVDLGTTNSSVAWTDQSGNVYSLKVRRGPPEPFDAVERSIVMDPLGPSPTVGHLAEGLAMPRKDAMFVSSFKRRFDKARLRQMAYQLVTTATSEYDPVEQMVKFKTEQVPVPVFYDKYSLDEVTRAGALVFNRLLTSTEIDPDVLATEPASSPRSVIDRLLGRRPATEAPKEVEPARTSIDASPTERLYVGIPVSFGQTARRRMLRCLVHSGCFGDAPHAYSQVLARCRLVYEPLALVSTLTLLESQNVFIFDYGGGTLDLAYLRVELDGVGRNVKELALGARPDAGDYLDELFRERLFESRPGLRAAFDQQVAGGPDDEYRAYSAFARAKVDLSKGDSTTMRLFGDVQVERSDFEAAIAGELDNVLHEVTETLARAGAAPRDVGTVLMTGGSSLIPAVQDRLRSMFPHLDDELAFVAGTPGDVESERRALTGVSRGLARFGFLESFEAGSPCTFSVFVPDKPGTRAICLERGAPDVLDLDESPPVRLSVEPGQRSIVVHSDLVRETYCGAVADAALPAGEVEVRLSASRERFAPAFVVRRPDTGEEIGRFDLDGMAPGDVEHWVEGDHEWVPLASPSPRSAFLTRPLELGDFVEWWNGNSLHQGKIVQIRHVSSGQHVQRIEGFDPSPYVIRAAAEKDGSVLLGQVTEKHWRSGDLRLA